MRREHGLRVNELVLLLLLQHELAPAEQEQVVGVVELHHGGARVEVRVPEEGLEEELGVELGQELGESEGVVRQQHLQRNII